MKSFAVKDGGGGPSGRRWVLAVTRWARYCPGMTELPPQGPLPRPENLDQARRVLRDEAFPAPKVDSVRFEATEFTSICPRTGQPDYGAVVIEYGPEERCLESKALKFYLWAYRDEGAFCESLAAQIADDVVAAIAPKWVKVEVRQNVRGGIGLVAVASR